MIELKIRFRPSRLHATIKGLILEMPDGTDNQLNWEQETALPYSPQDKDSDSPYRRAMRCHGLSFQDGRPVEFQALSNARVLGVCLDGQEDARIKGLEVFIEQGGASWGPMRAYDDDFPSSIPWPDLDSGARPMVLYFNKYGLATRMSCSGHVGSSMRRFWVEFQDSVTESQVAQFMNSHTPQRQGFTARGMFCERYDKHRNGALVKSLQYTAPCLEDAVADLAAWTADDMSGKPGHGAEPDGLTEQAAVALYARMLTGPEKDHIYRAVWKEHVLEDIDAWTEENDEPALTREQADFAADRYVYDGHYDCNLSYWENIAVVIAEAREQNDGTK